MTIKELKELAKKFREKEANPIGLPSGTNALRADSAYMWVIKFLTFVEKINKEVIDSDSRYT